MFLLVHFDLVCFSMSTLRLFSVALCLFSSEELKLCSENITSLEEQRDTLEEEIDQQKATDNR